MSPLMLKILAESLTDPLVQVELRWQKYLRRLRQGAWGDSIAIAAICNLFDVSINVLWVNQAGTSIVKNTPNVGSGKHELNIGLIMQLHFVSLDKLENGDHTRTPSVISNIQSNIGEQVLQNVIQVSIIMQ